MHKYTETINRYALAYENQTRDIIILWARQKATEAMSKKEKIKQENGEKNSTRTRQNSNPLRQLQ